MKPAKHLFSSTQNVLFIFFLSGLLFQQAHAQSPCDSLYIQNVQYSATNSDIIAITVLNENTGWWFNYPGFILYDQNGDTLAQETVDFFGIGTGVQVHHLVVNSNAQIPSGSFPATIELYTGFGDSLMCTWQQSVELCPTDSCIQAEIYLVNLDTLEAGTVYWSLYDTLGVVSLSGSITMDLIDHTHFDTVCLPPGYYELYLSPFSDIWIDDSYVLGITASYSQSIGTNTAQQNDPSPESLAFNWYEACIDGTNAIEELNGATFNVIQNNGLLIISSTNNSALGDLQLMDLQGRILQEDQSNNSSTTLNISSLSSGIYLLLNRTVKNELFIQKIFLH